MGTSFMVFGSIGGLGTCFMVFGSNGARLRTGELGGWACHLERSVVGHRSVSGTERVPPHRLVPHELELDVTLQPI